ncbi:hypothetical protein ACFL1X_02800 [Candidatus Hydrogenedentota bacterium]
MRLLVVDYLRRWWWALFLVSLFPLIFHMEDALLSLLELNKEDKLAEMLIFQMVHMISRVSLLSPACAAVMFFAVDEFRGVFTVHDNLPLSRKSHGKARWFAGVVIIPLIVLSLNILLHTLGPPLISHSLTDIAIISMSMLAFGSLVIMIANQQDRFSQSNLPRPLGMTLGIVLNLVMVAGLILAPGFLITFGLISGNDGLAQPSGLVVTAFLFLVAGAVATSYMLSGRLTTTSFTPHFPREHISTAKNDEFVNPPSRFAGFILPWIDDLLFGVLYSAGFIVLGFVLSLCFSFKSGETLLLRLCMSISMITLSAFIAGSYPRHVRVFRTLPLSGSRLATYMISFSLVGFLAMAIVLSATFALAGKEAVFCLIPLLFLVTGFSCTMPAILLRFGWVGFFAVIFTFTELMILSLLRGWELDVAFVLAFPVLVASGYIGLHRTIVHNSATYLRTFLPKSLVPKSMLTRR